jgi:hypothetical protein
VLEFKTWRGIDVEVTVPPSVRAEFIPHEMRYPRFRLEVNVAVLRMLEDLVDRDLASCVEDGAEPSDELLALHEALEAVDD